MMYEYDILVNESENINSKKSGSHKQYFCEAFCDALVAFFEKKIPTLEAVFTARDQFSRERMQKIQSHTYEKFLYQVVAAHKEHLKVEFCD